MSVLKLQAIYINRQKHYLSKYSQKNLEIIFPVLRILNKFLIPFVLYQTSIKLKYEYYRECSYKCIIFPCNTAYELEGNRN
jgi:hypothetical protein